MVRARLHIICGNCGSNDQLKYKTSKEIDDDSEEEYISVRIICHNCNTIHYLDNIIEK